MKMVIIMITSMFVSIKKCWSHIILKKFNGLDGMMYAYMIFLMQDCSCHRSKVSGTRDVCSHDSAATKIQALNQSR